MLPYLLIVLAFVVPPLVFVLVLRKRLPVIKTCPKCGFEYTLGIDGVVDGCDNCLGIQRDATGMAWLPGESMIMLEDVETGEVELITREEAFGLVR